VTDDHVTSAPARARAQVASWAGTLSDSSVRWICVALVSLPLVVALVALAGRDWYPVLDLAMTELRVRDVGSGETPLIGLPGRIGRLPEQGSHPGPLSFYLLAPVYRIFASSSYGLEVGSVLLGIGAIAASLWLAQRRGGKPLVLAVAAALVLLVRGYGTEVLVQPWNPYLPLLFWVVVLLAAWSVLAGDQFMIIVLVAAGSLCAQTHVPYLGLVLGLLAVCIVASALDWIRHPVRRNNIVRSSQLALLVAAVLWVPGADRSALEHARQPVAVEGALHEPAGGGRRRVARDRPAPAPPRRRPARRRGARRRRVLRPQRLRSDRLDRAGDGVPRALARLVGVALWLRDRRLCRCT
jgi:hypothetical protein